MPKDLNYSLFDLENSLSLDLDMVVKGEIEKREGGGNKKEKVVDERIFLNIFSDKLVL